MSRISAMTKHTEEPSLSTVAAATAEGADKAPGDNFPIITQCLVCSRVILMIRSGCKSSLF